MDLKALLQRHFEPVVQSYTDKDTMLYALGVGAGGDPLDPRELPYVYEGGLKAIPTLAVVLAYPGFWLRDPALKIDWLKLLHGEQYLEFQRPLAACADVRGDFRVIGVADKGVEKGAVVFFEKRISAAADSAPICTVRSTYFLRGDGGCGNYGEGLESPGPLPSREPDRIIDLPTLPQQALIYRLCGDLNPIHADPKAAAAAGFDRPILHGLCTMGIVCRGLIGAVCDSAPERLKSISLRFSSPVFPGELIRLEIFHEPEAIRFRARVVQRSVVILDRGRATLF